VVIVVELNCKEQKKCESKKLHFISFPSTFEDIKKKVEECCSIPACVQTLFYQEMEVGDSCDPSSLYMISGDTVKIAFPERGDCKEVKEVVEWLKKVTPVIKMYDCTDQNKILDIRRRYFSVVRNEVLINTLIGVLFYPWVDKTKRVNCSLFISLNGVELLITLHRHSIQVRKSGSCDAAIFISNLYELICCQAMANFAMDFTCRRILTEFGGLDQCMQSLLIDIKERESSSGIELHDIVTMALYAVCK